MKTANQPVEQSARGEKAPRATQNTDSDIEPVEVKRTQDNPFWLKAHQFQKGQSGNPNGRPKGKTLKEFAREFLEQLPDELKVEYLQGLSPEIVWRMAEGNPHSTEDVKHTIAPTPIMQLPAVDITKKDGGEPSAAVEVPKLADASP